MLFGRFLKRLTGSLQIKWRVLLLELFIVFIGVYLAFILNNYQESQRIKVEGEKIWSSLKLELEGIRLAFPGWAYFQEKQNEKWDSLFQIKEVDQFFTWRYIQPQYDFTTLEYAIATRESKIVDFDLYHNLTKLYQTVQQLEHIENLMTEIGLRYKNIPPSMPTDSQEYHQLSAENLLNFYRFIDFSKMRASNLKRIVDLSNDLLLIINKKLGKKQQVRLEKNYIQKQIVAKFSKAPADLIKKEIQASFPHFTESEILSIYEAAKKEIDKK
ncbi:MAG: hypothetical protein R2828_15460 [Saprospiraceae bacterium]